MKRHLLLALVLFFITAVPQAFAQQNSYVSIVNPIRGSDFWDVKDQKSETAVFGQIDILNKLSLPATWLLRFDALEINNITSQLKNRTQDEKGLFLEITPTWADQANVGYHQSDSWHNAGSAFLSGYARGEREKLIDAAFEKFKTTFGSYPVSVGAWWIDSYSLGYMLQKYEITSALIVADQYSTDNYQIWGQYFGTPYYPDKVNALHPAQNLENKLNIVVTQWAARDPVNGYGNGIEESTFSLQANDYIDYHNLDSKYFSRLIDVYTSQKFNQFSHLVVGLENSYDWGKYGGEYKNQVEILKGKKISVIPLKDFARFYKAAFPKLSPEQIIVSDDPLGSYKKVVWFMNPYYRAGWFLNADGSVFRDIRQYIEGEEELCFQKRCDSVNFATSATRVLDEVSFGHEWVIDQGRVSDFRVNKEGQDFIVSYTNEAGNLRKIGFLPRDISIDGKVFSIDSTILNATKKEDLGVPTNSLFDTSLKWSVVSVITKFGKFLLFLLFALIFPGLILTNNIFKKDTPLVLRLAISCVVGLVVLTLLFYITSLFKVKFLIYAYILLSLLVFIRFKFYKLFFINLPKVKGWLDLIIIAVVLAGVVFQVIPTFQSGLNFEYGVGFWGPNTHDGVWHLALINQLTVAVPSQNPIYSGFILKNYHFFYDQLVAATNYLSAIPVADLIFRFYPVIFSLVLGIGSYYLMIRLFENKLGIIKTKVAAFFGLYLIYFAGSFGWIVEYLREKHFGGESAFWVNQSVSFNLNPPFAVSLIIVIALLHILLSSSKGKSKIIPIILLGTLISFKSYTGILILVTLGVVALINVFKKNFSYLWIIIFSGILAGWLFTSNFETSANLIIFAPFWFIHSMIDSPDRVGWVRLSLARTASQTLGQWPKFFAVETLSLFIFILGNLGLRFFALGTLVKIKDILKDNTLTTIFIMTVTSVVIPILFIQSGNPWNTIQFFYPALYISALFSGLVISILLFRMNKVLALIFGTVILMLAPINSLVTASGYLSGKPHAFASEKESAGLSFLANLPDGVVLTYPYNGKLKQKIPEPWPILVYDSTAYVSALSKKAVYLEDEPQNQILLTDYKKRLVASKDFFLKPISENTKFLKENKIKYIYLPKIYNARLDESSGVIKNIYENEEVVIYQVN